MRSTPPDTAPAAADGRDALARAIDRLERDLALVRADPRRAPRTARLLEEGVAKMAKKVGEEAVELALDAVAGERRAVISETADLLYHLVVLLEALGVGWQEVGEELERRRARLGIAEKLPKSAIDPVD